MAWNNSADDNHPTTGDHEENESANIEEDTSDLYVVKKKTYTAPFLAHLGLSPIQ